MRAGWKFGALCWSSGKDLVMNKRMGYNRLYSDYVWPRYWSGVGFVYFVVFCDDTESVSGDVYCRMSNSKPCFVSLEHSAVAEGCLFGMVCLRWRKCGTFCHVYCATDAGRPSNAGRFASVFPVLHRSETVANLRRLWMMCFLFFLCILLRMYITTWT